MTGKSTLPGEREKSEMEKKLKTEPSTESSSSSSSPSLLFNFAPMTSFHHDGKFLSVLQQRSNPYCSDKSPSYLPKLQPKQTKFEHSTLIVKVEVEAVAEAMIAVVVGVLRSPELFTELPIVQKTCRCFRSPTTITKTFGNRYGCAEEGGGKIAGDKVGVLEMEWGRDKYDITSGSLRSPPPAKPSESKPSSESVRFRARSDINKHNLNVFISN
ncbi:hypothetical protein QVD17_20721 [Tagetes erecta]|uniref:Uncharacterized protein n=1 Tax=Tagetes erecta TaxID=13708 RepID=A0AAD8NR93_TARER|nr:hypothetical protein QVD17_20721 [Tagetes erecta]